MVAGNAIDGRSTQSIVVNNVNWYALFRVYCCSGNVVFVFYQGIVQAVRTFRHYPIILLLSTGQDIPI